MLRVNAKGVALTSESNALRNKIEFRSKIDFSSLIYIVNYKNMIWAMAIIFLLPLCFIHDDWPTCQVWCELDWCKYRKIEMEKNLDSKVEPHKFDLKSDDVISDV